MNRRAIIFDMDGVLVDTEPFYFEINRGLFGATNDRDPIVI